VGDFASILGENIESRISDLQTEIQELEIDKKEEKINKNSTVGM
jgi:hypothetical protein